MRVRRTKCTNCEKPAIEKLKDVTNGVMIRYYIAPDGAKLCIPCAELNMDLDACENCKILCEEHYFTSDGVKLCSTCIAECFPELNP